MDTRYQLVYFSNNMGIEGTPEFSHKLHGKMLEEKLQLYPRIFQEINLPENKPVDRLSFVSADGEYEIRIGGLRVDFIQQKIDLLTNTRIGGPAKFFDFITKAVSALSLELDHGRTKGTRLALVVQHIEPHVNEEQLAAYFERVVNPAQIGRLGKVVDWTYRVNVRDNIELSKILEQVNAIKKIERLGGQVYQDGQLNTFDRIFKEYDINTLPENINPRFSLSSLNNFAEIAVQKISNFE